MTGTDEEKERERERERELGKSELSTRLFDYNDLTIEFPQLFIVVKSILYSVFNETPYFLKFKKIKLICNLTPFVCYKFINPGQNTNVNQKFCNILVVHTNLQRTYHTTKIVKILKDTRSSG